MNVRFVYFGMNDESGRRSLDLAGFDAVQPVPMRRDNRITRGTISKIYEETSDTGSSNVARYRANTDEVLISLRQTSRLPNFGDGRIGSLQLRALPVHSLDAERSGIVRIDGNRSDSRGKRII